MARLPKEQHRARHFPSGSRRAGHHEQTLPGGRAPRPGRLVSSPSSRKPLRDPTCWPTGTRDNANLPPEAASLNGGHLAVPNPPPLTATHASRGRRVSNLGTRAQPRSCFLSLAEVDVGQELPAPVGHDQQLGQPNLSQASLKVLRFRETAGGLLNQIITFRRRFRPRAPPPLRPPAPEERAGARFLYVSSGSGLA